MRAGAHWRLIRRASSFLQTHLPSSGFHSGPPRELIVGRCPKSSAAPARFVSCSNAHDKFRVDYPAFGIEALRQFRVMNLNSNWI